MSKDRPLIGVTGPSKSSVPAWFFIRLMIWWAGGRAVHIQPNAPLPQKELSGLVLGGGADIDPSRYKEKIMPAFKYEAHQARHRNLHFFFFIFIWLFRRLFSLEFTTAKEDKERDELEISILNQVVEKKIPVLGICRGAQLINVFFGGSLYQDIKQFYTEQPLLHTILPKSTIIIDTRSKLYSILQKKYTRVNSLHHQAVKTLGQDIKVVAQETNGVIEAIEHMSLPFVIGVQWHPEFMINYRRQRGLFFALVAAARNSTRVRLRPPSSTRFSGEVFSAR